MYRVAVEDLGFSYRVTEMCDASKEETPWGFFIEHLHDETRHKYLAAGSETEQRVGHRNVK